MAKYVDKGLLNLLAFVLVIIENIFRKLSVSTVKGTPSVFTIRNDAAVVHGKSREGPHDDGQPASAGGQPKPEKVAPLPLAALPDVLQNDIVVDIGTAARHVASHL